jgi:hypothetical protein
MDWAGILFGTLVMVVPARDGLVIAADSRSSDDRNEASFCDQDFKLMEIERGPLRTVVTATGGVKFLPPSSPPADLCRYMRNAAPSLDFRAALKEYIEGQNQTAETVSLLGFAATANAKLAAYPFRISTEALLVVASYEPRTATSWVRSAKLKIAAGAPPSIGNETLREAKLEMRAQFYAFGDSAIAARYVDSPALKPETRQLRFAHVREISKTRAITAAVDFIEVVSTGTKTIGGPVDVLFIGSAPRAERIRWKSR